LGRSQNKFKQKTTQKVRFLCKNIVTMSRGVPEVGIEPAGGYEPEKRCVK